MIVQETVGREDHFDSPMTNEYDPDRAYTPFFPSNGTIEEYNNLPYTMDNISMYKEFFDSAKEGSFQPDVYCFFFPGGSGKFYVDARDNIPHPIDDNGNLRIERLPRNTGWKITTKEGVVHRFDIVKTSINRDIEDYYSNHSVYYMSQSTYPNGQHVTYSYDFKTIYSFSPPEDVKGELVKAAYPASPYNDANIFHLDRPNESQINEGALSSITTDNYVITFNGSAREDLYNGVKLDDIKITPNGIFPGKTASKNFKFDYDYFTSPVADMETTWPEERTDHVNDYYLPYTGKRLKLLNVYECDDNGNKNNVLGFEYNDSINLPQKNSKAVDYWGYYNGQVSNTTLIPNERFLTTYKEDGLILSPFDDNISEYTSLRAYDFKSCETNMLKRVNYPEGGYMEYTYEPHEYMSNGKPVPTISEIKAANTPKGIASVLDYNQPTGYHETELDATNGDCVLVGLQVDRGLNSWDQMRGCKYTLVRVKPTGSVLTIKSNEELTLPSNSNTDPSYKTGFSVPSDGGTYHLVVSMPESLGSQSGPTTNHACLMGTMTAYNLGDIMTRGYNYGGGVRVRQVRCHD